MGKTKNKNFAFDESSWESTFNRYAKFVARRLQPDVLSFYGDRPEDLAGALAMMASLDRELSDIGFKGITRGKFKDMCLNYAKRCRSGGNEFGVLLFFFIYEDYPFNDDFAKYLRKATPEEIENANRLFSEVRQTIDGEEQLSRHSFDGNSKVLDYDGLSLIIDKEYGDAWMLGENGEVCSFQLIWD